MNILLYTNSKTIGGYEIQMAHLFKRLGAHHRLFVATSCSHIRGLFEGEETVFLEDDDLSTLFKVPPHLVLGIQGSLLALAKLCKQHKIPFIWVCGYPPQAIPEIREHLGLLPLMFDHALVPSDYMKSYLEPLGLPVSTLPCIVPPWNPGPSQASLKRSAFGIPNEAFLLGYAARYVRHKNHFELLLACARSVEQGLDCHLLLLGWSSEEDTDYFDLLLKQLRSLGLENRVHFLTALAGEVPHFLRLLDLYVSVSVNEGMGCAVLEALSMNVPVILSAPGGAQKLITEENCGLVYPAGDVPQLVRCLFRLFSSKSSRLKMAQRGAQAIKHHHTVEQAAAHFDRLSQSLVN